MTNDAIRLDESIQVERHGDCWHVVQEGGSGVLSRHRRRLDAIADAMHLANMHRIDVLIRELDGSIGGPYGPGQQPPEMTRFP